MAVSFCWMSFSTLMAFQTTDPKELLKRASEACKNLEFIAYTSVFEQGGLTVEAQVIHQKAAVTDVGFGNARVIVRGDRVMGEEIQPFEFSYDGSRFKMHEVGNGEVKVIDDPTPTSVGRTLGLFYYSMVKRYLTDDAGLDFLIERKSKIVYGGEELVNGKPAIRLDITSNIAGPGGENGTPRTFQWYFDRENYLPVKHVTGSVTTLMKLTSQELKDDSIVFDINADDSYSENAVTGMEARTDGLLAIGTRFPDFELQDTAGGSRTLKDVTAKVTIIDFWGTWCGPCLLAMPDLQELYDGFHKQGLNVVGISVGDKPGRPEKLIRKKGFSYEFLVQGDGLASQLKIDTFPTLYVLDSDGIILHAEKGRRPQAKAALQAIIERNIK
jgi:peroxiredoxin